MKRILLVASLALLVAGAAAALWARQALIPGDWSPEAARLADAMALPGLVLIGHVDLAHAVEVEDLFIGEFDAEAIRSRTGDDSFIADLIEREANPADWAEHWLFGFIADETGGTVQALTGSIPQAELRAALAERNAVEDPRSSVWIVERTDAETCEPKQPIAVAITAGSVVFGTPQLVELVTARFSAHAQAETKLADWHAFRAGRTASLAFLVPAQVGESIPDPMLRMMAAGVSEYLGPIQAGYLGAQFSIFPRGVSLEARLETDDAAWTEQQVRKYDAFRDQLLAERAGELPSLAGILDRLKVESEGALLVTQLNVDEGFGEEVRGLGGEAFRLVASNTGFETPAPDTQTEEKTLADEALPRIHAQLDPSALPAASSDDPFAGPEHEVRSGAFAIRVQARRILSQDENQLELEIGARSGRIPNLQHGFHGGGESERLQLFVTSVSGHDGRELLASETCGPKRNLAGSPFRSGSDQEYIDGVFRRVAPEWSGSKAVRLESGTRLADVASLAGHIELRLPTAVESIRIEAPFAGQTIERDGIRLKFDQSASASDVKLDLSGDPTKLVSVRARNAAGSYLESGGATSMDRLFGAGKTASLGFRGTPSTLEVWIVSAETLQRVPFRLSDLQPAYGSWQAESERPVVQDRPAFEREVASQRLGDVCEDGLHYADVAPFALCLGDAQVYWGRLNARVTLHSPKARVIESALSPFEVQLHSVRIESGGDVVSVDAVASEFARPSESWGNEDLSADLWLQPQLEGQTGGRLVGMRGRLIHRLPRKLQLLKLDVRELGSAIAYTNGFRMRLVEQAGGALLVRMSGQRERIVQLRVRDSSGALLPTRNVRLTAITEIGNGDPAAEVQAAEGFEARVEVATLGESAPARLEVIYASEVDEWSRPFDVEFGGAGAQLAAAAP